jgi:hypothetical protein
MSNIIYWHVLFINITDKYLENISNSNELFFWIIPIKMSDLSINWLTMESNLFWLFNTTKKKKLTIVMLLYYNWIYLCFKYYISPQQHTFHLIYLGGGRGGSDSYFFMIVCLILGFGVISQYIFLIYLL